MTGHREFLVQVEIDTGSTPPDDVEVLRAAEAERAAELAAAGHLVALWRIPGRWANYGLWRASDTARLHEMLDSLPLRSHMKVTVEALDPHPSDPRSAAGSTASRAPAARRRVWALTALPELTVRCRQARQPVTAARHGTRRRTHATTALSPLPELSVRKRQPTGSRPPLGPSGVPGEPETAERNTLSYSSIDIEVSDRILADAATGDDALLTSVAVNAVHLLSDGDPMTAPREAGSRPVDVLVRSAAGASVLIENADQLSDRTIAAKLAAPQDDEDSRLRRTPTLEITHSGARGLRSQQVAVSSAAAVLDVGALTRRVAVRTLPDGGEAVGYAWTATLTLGVQTDQGVPGRSANLLLALRERLGGRGTA